MKLKSAANVVTKEFFQAALVTYLLLTLAETLREGSVSNFFNMNYLLLVVLVSGIGMVLTESAEQAKKVSKRVSRSVIRLAVVSARRAREARLAAQQQTQRFTKRPLNKPQRRPAPIRDFVSPRAASPSRPSSPKKRHYIDFISD